MHSFPNVQLFPGTLAYHSSDQFSTSTELVPWSNSNMVLSAENQISIFIRGYLVGLPHAGLRDLIKRGQYWNLKVFQKM